MRERIAHDAFEILRTPGMRDMLLKPADLLKFEIVARRESGYDVSRLESEVEHTLEHGIDADQLRLLEVLEHTQLRPDWIYDEPSDLETIESQLPDAPPLTGSVPEGDELRDRLLGAWLGRCAGCMLGQPPGRWGRKGIREYLELSGAYPLDDYFERLDPMPEGFEMARDWQKATRGNIEYMVRDDDIDYTIVGLLVLERYGFNFTADDIATEMLSRMPFLATSGAMRIAYRNLAMGMNPPETAHFRNPYREWIGAQIRADIYGYVSPGAPQQAAELAHRDASVSAARNGLYGSRWAAALFAACFTASNMRSALEAAVAQIPPKSRLAEAVNEVVELYDRGLAWETAWDQMDTRLGNYFPIHTINNSALITSALLWGEGDFGRTIGIAVQGGLDTDCAGATAGSAFGCMHGASNIPERWTAPLNDRARSAVAGYDNVHISELAVRTYELAAQRLPVIAGS